MSASGKTAMLRNVVVGLGLLGLFALGAVTSVEPLMAVVVAVLILGLAVFQRIEADRIAEFTVLGLIVVTPLEQWLGGLPLGPFAPAFVVLSDAFVGVLLVTLPFLWSRVAAQGNSGRIRRAADALAPVAVIIMVAALSYLAHPTPALDAVYWVRTHLRFVPVAVAVALLVIVRPGVVRPMLRTVLVSALIQSLIGIVEYVGGRSVAAFFWPGAGSLAGAAVSQADTFSTVGDRVVAGTLGHYNILGAYIALAFCIAVGARTLIDERRGRWPIVLPVLFVLTVALTQSRQSIAALATSMAVVALASGRRIRRVVVSGVLILALVGAGALIIGNSLATDIISRFEEVTTQRYWDVALSQNRGFVVSTVLPLALGYDAVLGTGPGSFGRTFEADHSVGESRLHLNPDAAKYVGDVGGASIAIQTGLLGLGAFLWMLAALATKAWSLRRQPGPWNGLAVTGMSAAAAFMVANLASSPFTYKAPSLVIWLLIGLVAGRSSLHGESGHDD